MLLGWHHIIFVCACSLLCAQSLPPFPQSSPIVGNNSRNSPWHSMAFLGILSWQDGPWVSNIFGHHQGAITVVIGVARWARRVPFSHLPCRSVFWFALCLCTVPDGTPSSGARRARRGAPRSKGPSQLRSHLLPNGQAQVDHRRDCLCSLPRMGAAPAATSGVHCDPNSGAARRLGARDRVWLPHLIF